MPDNAGPRAERLLVGVGPSASAASLIRAAQGVANGLQAEWFAVYVETPKMLRLPETERLHAVQNLRLAEQLGAEGRHPEGPASTQRWSISPAAADHQNSPGQAGPPLPLAGEALAEPGG